MVCNVHGFDFWIALVKPYARVKLARENAGRLPQIRCKGQGCDSFVEYGRSASYCLKCRVRYGARRGRGRPRKELHEPSGGSAAPPRRGGVDP
jgi:hypothetical protein